jgi:hypothetical protein
VHGRSPQKFALDFRLRKCVFRSLKIGISRLLAVSGYRNHGADFVRVLAAFEVPDQDYPEFQGFLSRVRVSVPDWRPGMRLISVFLAP